MSAEQPGLLDSISSPADVKALARDDLPRLAEEIRRLLIETVSKTGGHLAANLGVVELTLALHYVFDSPRDRVIWDVGHQCYTHKLLTGRRGAFDTLRQWGGLSGFPSRHESEHDAFNTGHGSTSISAALGVAAARDLAGGQEAVVAVIGDGALTGGMAFEALNQAGHLKRDLIVVLNDNAMSISPNVGALAGYLSRLRLDPNYLRAKDNFEHLLQRLPLGAAVLERVDRFKAALKQLLVPGMLFEELGFTYLGPIDGHQIGHLIDIFQHAREQKGPILIHVVTRKGRGYPPAESDAGRFHGTPAFDIATGEPAADLGGTSYTAVFGETLVRLAEADPRIVAVTAAMCEGCGLTEFARRFPDRFFDVGMAEQHAVTFAAGLATRGLRPVVAVYSTFLQRGYDQVLHDICLPKLPVVLAIDRAGVVGEDGPTHQGKFDLSYLRHIPNLTLMAPKDLTELAAMLRTAIESAPAALRYPRGPGLNPPQGLPEPISRGQGEVLREGDDVALIAIGSMVWPSLVAADALAGRGVRAAVVNARFVRPLDEHLLLKVGGEVGRVVTVEENALAGGFGAAVLELYHARGLDDVKVRCLGLPDAFIEHGARGELLARLGLTPEQIREAAAALVAAGAETRR
jgi:1-deoxy-D-xylulose-5-phosphate synthase